MADSFKKQVLDWLAQNGIYPKRVRVYNSRKYGLEVRCYTEPMTYTSERISFRTTEKTDTQRIGTRGHHTIKHAMFCHINEDDFKNPEEKAFALQVFKDSFTPSP